MHQLQDLACALCAPSRAVLLRLSRVLFILFRSLNLRPDPRSACDPRSASLRGPLAFATAPLTLSLGVALGAAAYRQVSTELADSVTNAGVSAVSEECRGPMAFQK